MTPTTSLTLHILLVLAGGDHDAPAIIEGIARDSQGTQLSGESSVYKALKRLQRRPPTTPSEHNRDARVASLLHERLS